MTHRALSGLVVALGLFGSAGAVVASPTRVVDMTSFQTPGSSLDVDVALGDDGTLAFRSIGPGAVGSVYRGSILGGTSITIVGDQFGQTRSLSVNPQGDIGFVGAGGHNLYRSSGGVLLTIRGDAFGISDFGMSRLGADGQFAFGGTTQGGRGLFTGPSSTGSIITIHGLNAAGISEPTDMDSDGDGIGGDEVAFRAVGPTGAPGIYAIGRGGGTVITLTGRDFLTGGTTFTDVGEPSINGDSVVFRGSLSNGEHGLYSASLSGGVLLTVRGLSFGEDEMPGASSVNRRRSVTWQEQSSSDTVSRIAFASLDGGGPETLISVGDPLDGSIVTRLVYSPEAFNNFDQLAFYAELADGTAGIYLASSIPGPSVLAGLGVAGAFCARRRR